MPPRVRRGPYRRRLGPQYITFVINRTYMKFWGVLLAGLCVCSVCGVILSETSKNKSKPAARQPIAVDFRTIFSVNDMKPVLNLATKISKAYKNYPEISRLLEKLISLLDKINGTESSAINDWHDVSAWLQNPKIFSLLNETIKDMVAIEKNPRVSKNPILYGPVCLIRNFVDVALHMSSNYSTDVNEIPSYVMPPK